MFLHMFAWAVFRLSDDRADASAAAIRRLRTSSDPSELSAAWRYLWMLRDASLFAAVGEIASDRAASRRARIWALRTLATYIDPQGVYAALTDTINGPAGVHSVCITGRASGAPELTVARPLPTNFEQQARDLASGITHDESDDPVIRRAASCVVAAPVYAILESGSN